MNYINNIHTETIKKAAQGDIKAQEALYRQFAKPMYNICIRMTGSIHEAKDILQDSFLITFKELRNLKNKDAFAGWFKQIVIRQCIRKLKKSKIHFFYLSDCEIIDDRDDNKESEIRFKKIHESIKQLPDGCRQVFTLYALEDWPHKKIAEELNISESTSKSQYQRARKLLQKLLKKEFENG